MATVRLGSRKIRVPGSRIQRVAIGILLVCVGFLGFLPVLGFWMIPLGIVVLSIDFHPVRRLRRRFEVRFGRWRQSRDVHRFGTKRSDDTHRRHV